MYNEIREWQNEETGLYFPTLAVSSIHDVESADALLLVVPRA